MKNILYITVIGIVLWSCGGGGDEPPPTPKNNAPTVPSLVYPSNNLLCIDNVLDFDWNASIDPDGDAITYQVQVATDSQFSQITHTSTISTTNQSISLDKGIAYYWRVKATDSKNLSSNYSATNQFYTEGEGISNHLPFSPVVVSPTLNAIVQQATTTLEWTASDVDTGDVLTFDVYFGTENPPTAIDSGNQSATTLNVDLTASTTYYWKVVVKDGQGAQTIGQVWNFTTD